MKRIYERIKDILEDARDNAYRAVNSAMVFERIDFKRLLR